MPRSSLALFVGLLACQPPADQWTEADIQHSDESSSDSGGSYGFEVALLIGEVEIIPKTSIEGAVQFIAGIYNPSIDDVETLSCVIDLDLRSANWRPDCEACEEAYDFTADSVTVHVDDGTCEDFGFTEETLEQFEVALGFGSDLLYYSDAPEEWEPVAETYYSEGFTRFEWVIEMD